MDYGLEGLSDDQWLELLQAVLENGASRDPFVRRAGQQAIMTTSEKLDAAKSCMQGAIDGAKKEYIASLKKEITDQLAHDVEDGTIRLITQQEETRIIAEATLEAKIQFLDRAIKEIESGQVEGLSFKMTGAHVSIECGTFKSSYVSKMSLEDRRKAGHYLYELLTK